MEPLRNVTPGEMARIPGVHLLTHVGVLHSEEVPGGSSHTVRAVVRAPSDSPLMRGRSEWSHVVFVEASYNLSHWITDHVPAVAAANFKSTAVFPRGMGMPPLRPDESVEILGRARFQRAGVRWRGEVEVQFFRGDGTLVETVSFPLVERLPGA